MVQEAFLNFTHVSIDFTLKIFPACYTSLALIERDGAKLENLICPCLIATLVFSRNSKHEILNSE